jgi:hypothetical protein
MSGAASAKKWMPWECRIEPKLSAWRSSVAARGGVTEKTLSTDLAEARW